MTKAKAKTVGIKSPAPGISDVKTGRTSSTRPTKSERDAQAAREGSAAQDRQTVHLDTPAGAVDVNQLVELLVRRLAPGQLIVGTGIGGTGSGPERSQITESGSNYDARKTMQTADFTKIALKAGPLETEMEALSNKLTVLHSLITELDSSLEPLLAHESDSADSEGPMASRSSESPHHRRLIDLGEGLDRALVRLRYTQSRVRT